MKDISIPEVIVIEGITIDNGILCLFVAAPLNARIFWTQKLMVVANTDVLMTQLTPNILFYLPFR